jgi:hypothetical protein
LPEAAHPPEGKLAQLGIIADPRKYPDQRAAQGINGDADQQQARK